MDLENLLCEYRTTIKDPSSNGMISVCTYTEKERQFTGFLNGQTLIIKNPLVCLDCKADQI